MFNSTLDLPAAAFCTMADEQDWGYRLDEGTNISLILFADNFWLYAYNPLELGLMLEAWLAMHRDAHGSRTAVMLKRTGVPYHNRRRHRTRNAPTVATKHND